MVTPATVRMRFATILIWIAGALSAFSQTRQVVLLYDERIDLPGLALFNTGFTRALTSGSPGGVEIYREEMDLSRFDSPEYRDLLRERLRAKYVAKKIDVVVAVMAPAVDFLVGHRDEVFPGIPIVFAALDRKQLSDRSLPADATGVLTKREFSPTLDLVVRLHPNTERIVVVAGTSEYDAQVLGEAREQFKPFEKRFAFTYLTNLPLAELLSRLSQLPPKTVVLYTSIFRDGAGQPHEPYDVVGRISASANAPVFGFTDQYVGRGIVGGQVYGFGTQGEEAAGLVLKILAGQKPEQLSPIEPKNTVAMFDARQLQRWKIDERHLPIGSTVLFRDQTLWSRYRMWIIGGISFCILQTLLIVRLLVNLVRRRRAEGFLIESEERFRIVADSAPVLIWVSGLDKLCTFFNKGWLDFTGRTMEQEMGNGWTDGVHPDDLERCLKIYTEAFDARQPFVMQYRLRRHDREYRWITDNGVPRYDAQKNFMGYIGSCVDISESRSKEQALRESEERMSLAMDAAKLGLWEWNVSKDELWGTKARRALLGLPTSAKIKLEDGLLRVHVNDRDRVRRTLKDAARTGEDYHLEYRVVLPDGSVQWTDHRGRCVRGADGKDLTLRGISMDVTERKRAEEKFRMAVEASPSGILLIDHTGQIVLVNSHIEQLFGYGREELLGQSVDILVPERFASEHPEHRAKFFAAPTARAMGAGRDLFARRKDGSEFPVEIGLNPIQSPEGTLVLAAVVDISARKLAQAEALRHREEVSHLGRVAALGELAASIAHELNQPLAGIVSNASAGRRFIDRGDVDLRELRELLGDIVADGRRAGDVIRGIRGMVKKGARVQQRINLNDLIMNVVRMIKPDATLRSCELKTLLDPNLPSIEGDSVQLQQVLLNLLTNAFDAMRETPSNRRHVVIMTEQNGDGTIGASVRDYGAGIPAEVLDRLFDHFFTTKAEGMGMGLAIVRSIIESHAGTIAAENVEGGGARFHFTLPINPASGVHSAV